MRRQPLQSSKDTALVGPRVLSHRKTIAFAIVTAALGFLACAAMGEIFARACGYRPWRSIADNGRPVTCEADPVLGWRHKPGFYSIENFTLGSPPFDVTILADGRRATARETPEGRPVVAIVGCSITAGWGLTDSDTYPWKLQASNPGVEIRNFAVPAYGTYQALLTLERLCEGAKRPALVLYGFIDDHETRNVAGASFLEALAEHSSRGHLALPYCLPGPNGALRRFPPTSYADFPLKESLAIANVLQRRYMKLTARPREAQQRIVTERLLDEMAGVCRQAGTDFAVVMLLATNEGKSHYLDYCQTRGITCYDCVYPLTRETCIRGEGHPNATLNELWARRINECIAPKLVTLSLHSKSRLGGGGRAN